MEKKSLTSVEHDALMGKILGIMFLGLVIEIIILHQDTDELLLQAVHVLMTIGVVASFRSIKTTWQHISLYAAGVGAIVMLLGGSYQAVLSHSLIDIFAIFTNTVIAGTLDGLLAGIIWLVLQYLTVNHSADHHVDHSRTE